MKGYTIAQAQSDYAGVPQRWFIVESKKRRTSDLEQLEKRLESAQKQAQQALKKLCSQDFACEADALIAAQRLDLPWHHLHQYE